MIKWAGPNRHRSFVGHRIWRAHLGKVVVALIEQRDFQQIWETNYEVSFTLPVGQPMDWSDTGRENNINGRAFKTLQGAKAYVERAVGKWLKRAGLRARDRKRSPPGS